MKRIYCKLLLIKYTWHVLDVWSKCILILFCGKAYGKSFKNNSDLILCTGGFPGDSEIKASACNAGDLGLIPGWGRSPGEGKGYPLQYSGLENSMNCIAHRAAKSHKQLSDCHLHFQLAISYSRVFPWPRDQNHISCIFFIARWIFYHCITWEVQ